MNVKYLCKKRFLNKTDGGYVEVGDIVEVDYTGERYGRLVRQIHAPRDARGSRMKITPQIIREHLVLYDEIECVDAYSVLRILSNKFTKNSNEKDILSDLKFYINKRLNFLKQCEKKDIRQEQDLT